MKQLPKSYLSGTFTFGHGDGATVHLHFSDAAEAEPQGCSHCLGGKIDAGGTAHDCDYPNCISVQPAADDKELADMTRSRDWYKCRVNMLHQWQSKMRDPERTIVCDILANGQMLPDPDGKRYGPAADDKAGGEQVNGKEHGHIGWLSRNRAGKLDMLTDLEIDASNGEWSRLFKLYTHPQPQADVRVPDGWHFSSADFSMQASGKSAIGSVMLVRDMEGLKSWCALSDDDRERVELYVSGKGTTVMEAIADAASKAMLAAAPKPKD